MPSRGCRGQVGAPRCVAHHARLSAKGRECPHGGFRLQGSRACLVTSHGGSRASPWKRGVGTRSFGGDDLRAEGSGGTENVRWRGGRQLVPVRCHRPPSTEKYARGAGRLRHLFSDEAGFGGPAVPRRQGRGWGGSTLSGGGGQGRGLDLPFPEASARRCARGHFSTCGVGGNAHPGPPTRNTWPEVRHPSRAPPGRDPPGEEDGGPSQPRAGSGPGALSLCVVRASRCDPFAGRSPHECDALGLPEGSGAWRRGQRACRAGQSLTQPQEGNADKSCGRRWGRGPGRLVDQGIRL